MANLRLEEVESFKRLRSVYESSNLRLSTLLSDESRCNKFIKQWEGVTLDISRQLINEEVLKLLFSLADEMKVRQKIEKLFNGGILNESENRPVLHTALRLPAGTTLKVGDEEVSANVQEVLSRIRSFSGEFNNGTAKASDGGTFDSILCIGIGGSFLGTAFASESFLGDSRARLASKGKKIRFLSNVDPAGFRLAIQDLDPNRTMVVVISKTFTTTETLKNAVAVKKWLLDNIAEPSLVGRHLCAISTNLKLTKEFGIEDSRVFGFWDWVGGRFSVSSAVGVLPLSLYFGYDLVQEFLDGCHAMDQHFLETELPENLPVLMALCSFYNSAVVGLNTVAVLPYSQDLSKFPAYIQQLTMESNGKSVRQNGESLPFDAGEFYFGEPGTNGQHSFYQLLHQGRRAATEFIGYIHSDNTDFEENGVTYHQELMANFFAQPDALAYGISIERVMSGGASDYLARHKASGGNRPSQVLLFERLTPFTIGLLVSLYEHRTAVQGFLFGINSFDQMGVELGKVLATDIRKLFARKETDFAKAVQYNKLSYSTSKLLSTFTKK